MPMPAQPWTKDDTADYLAANPLPVDFRWKHRDGTLQVVHPSYRTSGGYGKWLRETPYFPGLFEEIHDVIVEAGARLPDIDEIARLLTAERELRAKNDEPLPF